MPTFRWCPRLLAQLVCSCGNYGGPRIAQLVYNPHEYDSYKYHVHHSEVGVMFTNGSRYHKSAIDISPINHSYWSYVHQLSSHKSAINPMQNPHCPMVSYGLTGAPHWLSTGSSPRRLALGATLQPGGWVSAMGCYGLLGCWTTAGCSVDGGE